jgi:hypothetical protein
MDPTSSSNDWWKRWSRCSRVGWAQPPLLTCRYSISVRKWCVVITANVGTEGAVKIFLFWDVFKELLVTQPVLHRFGWNLGRSVGLIHAQLVIESDLWKYYILGNLCFWTIFVPNSVLHVQDMSQWPNILGGTTYIPKSTCDRAIII